ncbi:single-stranded DNA-binding protein [Pseudomonas reactans]|uniref:single-stranded DNA-binding protein n=1 Tax=Pseudomonas reactans TaxID=117680 RepID=UPI0015C10246|nr:single-stranded DNA-binding protein [Pseudomonas reactans]NWD84871.1 single-stranded DNA-binding protein [Pseudomonas reactans]
MSTFFVGEGNIGSAPEFQEFASGNDEPRRLLRLNVYFDNPIPREGSYEDRGGYWAPVELWHREAEHWSTLYQKGMRERSSEPAASQNTEPTSSPASKSKKRRGPPTSDGQTQA